MLPRSSASHPKNREPSRDAARLGNRNITLAALAGLGISAALHGLYDFFVIMKPRSTLPAAAGLVGALWLWRLNTMRRLQHRSVQPHRG